MAGTLISIANQGPSPFTEICLDFGGVRVGDTGSPANIGEFRYKGKPVDQKNPLPAGATAWTKHLREVATGTQLVVDAVGSFGNGFSNLLNHDKPVIEVDVTVLDFDFATPLAPDLHLKGEFRFVSRR